MGKPAGKSNRFALPLEDLPGEVANLAARVSEAGRQTLSEIQEADSEGEYFQAPGLTPKETYTRISEEVGRVMAICAVEGFHDRPFEADDIALIHEGIFRPVFGDKCLSFRRKWDGRDDGVQFPILVGPSPEEAKIKRVRGTGGRQIRKRLKKVCADFASEVEELGASEGPKHVADSALPALRLYARVIAIHPFFDGNGRTAMAVLAYAYQRAGLPYVSTDVTVETRWALGKALQSGKNQDYGPLVDIVAETVRSSEDASN